ncbi:MAG: hypothetical protein NVS3B10_09940 [Polyangiales bacterium]
MSRLDGSQPASEPSDDRASDPGRPSAAELLGRGRRRRTAAIRVPDDATPPPPPVRRSQPPPAPVAAVPVEIPAAPRAPAPVAAAPRPVDFDTAPTVRITPTRMIQVGAPAPTPRPSDPAPPPDVPSIVVAAAASSVSPSRLPSTPPPRPAPAGRINTPYPMPSPFTSATMPAAPPPSGMDAGPGAPPRAEFAPELVIKPVPVPAGAMISQPLEPISPASTMPMNTPVPASGAASGPQPVRAPTVPNLDQSVREALDLLDREDFEATGIDIAVVHEEVETQPRLPAIKAHAPHITDAPPSEESLDDSAMEEVASDLTPSGKPKVAAPVPPPRKTTGRGVEVARPLDAAMPATTLPSARITESTTAPAAEKSTEKAAETPASAPAPAMVDQTGEIKKKKRQWFEELFNDDFQRTMPRQPAVFLDREVQFIEDSLGCEKGATILDLACGPGEHAVRLAKRGYEVIGIDLSLSMLARAADEAAALDARINFVQGDMRELSFEEAFDGVYCWGTSFGYFDETKNVEVLQKVHRALRRGGRLLLDVVNRDYVIARQPNMAWFEGEGCVCMDEMMVNAITSRLQVKRTMMMEDGRQREIDYTMRIYSLHELGKMLHECGFRVAEASGDTSTPGSYFGAESPRILILAEKR